MATERSRGLLLTCLVLILTLASAQPVLAQRDTGIMVVRALAPDDLGLPGVMVVARGPVGTQTQYTGIDGSARFPGLYPGSYSATFTLDGFKTVVREGLVIQAQRATSFDIGMELATVEETITVTGESPVVDVKTTNVTGLYTDDLIDNAPTASGLWAGVLDHVPGVVNSNYDVGGGESGQQSGVYAWGSQAVNNSYNVNGGDTSDPVAVGWAGAYYSVSSFEEVSVSLAAQDVEIKTPGVNMNMVVKSGSNDWHAGVKYFYEGEGLVSDNVDDALREEGIEEGTPNELLSDLDVQGGGPIWPDRAWFFVDYWRFDIRRVVLGLEERDRTEIRDWTINLNGQINQDNKISGRYLRTAKYRNNRGATRSRPYLGWVQDGNSHVPQLQWQSVINQNVFSDLRFSSLRINFPLVRRDDASSEAGVPYEDSSATYDFARGNFVRRPSNPIYEWSEERDSDNFDGAVSWYVTGEDVSHDIKFGGQYTRINYLSPFVYPNGYRRYVRSNRDPEGNPYWMTEDPELGLIPAVPVEVRLYNPPIAWGERGPEFAGASPDCGVLNDACWKPDNAFAIKGRATGLFVQDIVTIANKVTITGGLRWDYQYAWNPAQNRLDSPWCGQTEGLRNPELFCGGTFPEEERPFTWSDVVPRVGLVYDIMGDGRWAAKFNYSRYGETLGVRYAWDTNVNLGAYEDWNWYDPNGDGMFQFGEQTTFRSQRIPGVTTAIDADLKSPLLDEFTVGLEHEIFDNILFSVTGIFRGMDRDNDLVNAGRPFGPMIDNERCLAECTPTYSDGSPRPLEDPWVPVETVDPGIDGEIGTPDDGGPIYVWAVDPATRGTSVELATNTTEWGFEDGTDYKGVSFVVSKRWSNNWQLLASYDYGRGYNISARPDPNRLFNQRRQEQFASRPHVFKLTGNYLFAEPMGVNLGLFIRANSGEPVQAWYYYDNEVLEDGSGFCCQSNTWIAVDARGEGNNGRPSREDFVTLVDIRAEKQVTIGNYGVLHFYFDVFNLFNANTVTEFDWDLGPSYAETIDILPPRVIRIGGAWDF